MSTSSAPGVEQVRGVSMAQLVGTDFLLDAGLLQHPPQIGAGGLRRQGATTRVARFQPMLYGGSIFSGKI